MSQIRFIALCVAAAALAGCNNDDHTIVGGAGADEPTNNAAAPVVLPPMIQASQSYRCKDNSTVFVDWFNDSKTANLKATRDGAATVLTAPEAGQPYTADGYALAGKAGDKQVSVTRPGKGEQTCHG